MKRKIIYCLYILPLVMMVFTLSSCSDDDDDFGGAAISNSYVGNWFLDWSSTEKKMWVEMDFDASGNFKYYNIMSSLKEGLNLREKIESTYSKDGNTLVCRFDWSSTGTSSTERFNITYVDKYTLVLTYDQTGSEETYSRIVDEYYIKVGESTQFEFNDSEFANANYSTTDERIAKVDDNGNITAVRHGITYITARTGVGAVTIKVNVIDVDQPYTEYGEDLSLTKQQVIEKYGDNYMEDKVNNRLIYYMGDMDTHSVNFTFTSHDKVKIIMVSLWEPSYVSGMAKFFESKYQRVGQEDDDFNLFYNEDDKCRYHLYTDLGTSVNGYERILPDFEKYDDLTSSGSADELAAEFGYTITEEDGGHCFISIEDGDMYDFAMIGYDEDTREIAYVSYVLKEGYTVEQVTEMVKEFYPFYMEGLGYCASEYWWTLSPIVFVEVEEDEDLGVITLTYTKL